jgi:Tfp pilus assembly PilM family ATPase
VNEVSRTTAYYSSKIGGQKLAQIYLTGGGGDLLGLQEYLGTKLGVDIVKVQISSDNISINKKVSEKFSKAIDLSAFNVSLGLSMKSRTIFE